VTPSRHFRLERVRALREQHEDRAKEELAASLAHRLRGEALFRRACEALDTARGTHVSTVGTGDLHGGDLIAMQAWLDRVERERRAAELDLDRRDAEVGARRDALTQAAQDRQALERLKDRWSTARAAHVERLAAGELDEIALRGHVRRSA
jgi:flagellar export protein FliJ